MIPELGDTFSRMEKSHRATAEQMRTLLGRGEHEPSRLRSALLAVPARERDAWLDLALGLSELPDDDPQLPRGCVPYLPCPVDHLLQIVEHAPVCESDVFVDIGAGLGRATTFVHLLTGASAVGIEIQSELVAVARGVAARLHALRIQWVEGDAAVLAGSMVSGTVFFLYCPFSGERLAKVLADLESIARNRQIRVCCVDLELPARAWLTLEKSPRPGLMIYRSNRA